MTPKERAVMQQALEALCQLHFAATERDKKNRVRWFDKAVDESIEAITALREALAEQAVEQEQEPVAVVEITYGREPECYFTGNIDDFPEGVFKLYAAPVRTKDLTDDEIVEVMETWGTAFMNLDPDTAPDPDVYIARAVIAADREKNK